MKFNILKSDKGSYIYNGDHVKPATEAEEYFYEKIIQLKNLLEKDDSGDLEYIKYRANKILSD